MTLGRIYKSINKSEILIKLVAFSFLATLPFQAFAQNNGLKQQIYELAEDIQGSVFGSTASSSDLRQAKNLLEESLDIINGGGFGGGEVCDVFNPLAGETSPVFTLVRNPGYRNHGTLKWPNGNIFMLRHQGYRDDYTLYYPDGTVMRLRHGGYRDDRQTYWPNGAKLKLKHSGYRDDGTIYRHDGSVWLLRHRGYRDDRQRYGLPVDRYESQGEKMTARLTNDDNVTSVYSYEEDTYSVEIELRPDTNQPVAVKTCY